MFKILVLNPKFPKDKTQAKALTADQLEKISPWLVEHLNKRVKITDQQMIDKLQELGCPLVFDEPQLKCKHCGVAVTVVNYRALSSDPAFPQYCYVDPGLGSRQHEV